MKIKTVFFLSLLSFTILASSCSFQKLLKSDDYEAKYVMAQEYYNNKDYSRALQLMDQIIPIYKGTDKAQKLAYMYANSYFEQKDYILASYYFKRYYKNYPLTEKASDALFYSAYCNYLNSPKSSLDQENTHLAISEIELFIKQFPNSNKSAEAEEILLELKQKLIKKDYDIAYQYYKMEKYTSSITAFESFLKKYPVSDYREHAMYYILSSNYEYARQSLPSKQKERYLKTIGTYLDFIAIYPESKFLKQANNINANASAAIGRNITETEETI